MNKKMAKQMKRYKENLSFYLHYQKIKNNINAYQHIEYLNIDGNFTDNIDFLKHLKNLKGIYITNSSIKEIPHIKTLTYLYINNAPHITKIPNIKRLRGITITNCPNIREIPEIKGLINLHIYAKDDMHREEIKIPELKKLKVLYLTYITINNFPELKSLTKLELVGVKTDKLPKLNKLKHLELMSTDVFIHRFKKLKNLHLSDIYKDREYIIPSMNTLKELNVHNMNAKLPNQKLDVLNLYGCNNIVEIKQKILYSLTINNCKRITSLNGIKTRRLQLDKLNIEEIDNMEEVRDFHISDCNKLKRIRVLSKMCSNFIVSSCQNLKTIELGNFTKYFINVLHCPSLEEFNFEATDWLLLSNNSIFPKFKKTNSLSIDTRMLERITEI